jgi:hypothetical protein
MPTIRTISLPTFLPFPGEQLRNHFPANHDSLSSMLGLCLGYLKVMHPAKLAQPDESMRASAHIINLLINDPLVQSLLPKSTPANTAPVKELNSLQIRLTSLENTLTNLAKATTDARKEFKAQSQPPSNTAKPSAPAAKGPAPLPTYAAKAASPQRPSVVVDTSAYTWPNNRRPQPADICATINAALDHSNATQVRSSAARWTAKGNLVIWGGANTTAHQLTTALPHFSEALQTSFSALAESAPQSPPTLRPNVKWSKLRLNSVPTGKTANREAYQPIEVHNALIAENPAYATLSITQKPSWVRDPRSYASDTLSSLSVSFEDPDGTCAQNLLRHRTLYAFGHVITVKRWKQSPPKSKPNTNPAPPRNATPGPSGNFAPSETGPQPSTYTSNPNIGTIPPELAAHRARKGKTRKQDAERGS